MLASELLDTFVSFLGRKTDFFTGGGYNALRAPIKSCELGANTRVLTMEVANINIDIFLRNEDDCLELIKKDWNKIPLLNANDVQNLHEHRLVRFRGMVQDMFNPEYYFEKYEVVNEVTTERFMKNGRFYDIAECKDNEIVNLVSDDNVTAERHTFILISLPGLNKWAEDIERKRNKIAIKKDATTSPTKTCKRVFFEEETLDLAVQPSTSSKKLCTKPPQTENNPVVSREHILNFPLPDQTGKACQIKVYSNSDAIKLNDMIECVGFLSVNSTLSESANAVEGESAMELQTHNPPASLVPRIHCVTFKKFKNCNPLCDEGITMTANSLQFLRKELHIVLTHLTFGDELVGEYLLYHLISSVYLRKDLMALGKFALNISNIPNDIVPNYGQQIYLFLEQLVPKSHYLPMTLENMNDLTFIPKKDYDCNRITSGILQISENTHLILDETKLTPGKLNTSGVSAVGAISNVIKNQRINYDFNYYQMEYDCDIPFLILSEGKSMLPSDVHVPLLPEQSHLQTFNETVAAMKVYLKPELLDPIRTYLSERRHAEYELSDEVQQLVEAEFVKMRQIDNATAYDLHQLLVLARVVCLAEGRGILDEGCWKRACQLEVDRKARLR